MKSANNRFEHTLICVFVTLCSSFFFENKNANWSRVKYRLDLLRLLEKAVGKMVFRRHRLEILIVNLPLDIMGLRMDIWNLM
jgi:hypothetical protein